MAPNSQPAQRSRSPDRFAPDTGLTMLVEHGLDRLADADLLCVLGWEDPQARPSAAVCSALRAVVDRGGRVRGPASTPARI